jgi:hypothetical protein
MSEKRMYGIRSGDDQDLSGLAKVTYADDDKVDICTLERYIYIDIYVCNFCHE